MNGEYFDKIWPAFHAEASVVHGAVHYTPSFADGSCDCEPCKQRLLAEASKSVVSSQPPR